MRKTIFANKEYYHIYNRGVDGRKIFLDDSDYHRFLISMILLNDKKEGLLEQWRNLKKCNRNISFLDFRRLNLRNPLVDFVAYCLNPNHYHFILRQLEDGGIKKIMHKLGTAYTMYFNRKQKRSGALFQGRFKSINVDSNEYLLYLSAYVNKNNFIHGYGNQSWKYSSFGEYENNRGRINLCDCNPILSQFRNLKDYEDFLKINSEYLKKKKEDQKYLLEDL